MLITASIVTYRTDHTELARCLQSLDGSAIAEIYVCDNSPSDDLKDFCQSWPKVTYIFNNANLGYGSGHNVALRRSMAAHSDYHLVINSDVYFDCTAIEKITEFIPTGGCNTCADCCPPRPTSSSAVSSQKKWSQK